MSRVLRAAKSFHRLRELIHCFRNVREYNSVIPAFLGVKKLQYPAEFHNNAGLRLKVYDFEDLTTLWAVWCADEYRIPSDAKVIVDAGANIGAFSLFAMAAAPNARIVALEPFPSTFEKLAAAISSNKAGNTVTCKQVALTDRKTTLFMDADPEIKSHSRKTDAMADSGQTVAVDGWGMDEIAESLGVTSIDYLKVDIEGGEVPFFAGVSAEALRRVRKIGVECHSQAGQDQVWAKIEAAGFKLDRISRGTRTSGASTAEFIRA